MRGDRSVGAVGAVIGIGAVVGLGVLFLSRRASASASGGSPRERPAPGSWSGGRYPPLVERWRGEIAKRAKDLPVNALLEWLRIESGGDMCSTGIPGHEAGIWQLWFPDDAKYGATYAELMALCEKSKGHVNPYDISWMTEADLDKQVGSGINKILAGRDTVRRVFASNGVRWPETSFDFGSAVKQIHAAPAVITELVPKISRRDGAPSSWSDLRQKVLAFPVDQMGPGLRGLAHGASQHKLKNRLEDTLANAEIVGRAWGSSA